MQRIYTTKSSADRQAAAQRWIELCGKAGSSDILDTPHRWANGNEVLGQWICCAREILRSGGKIDLRGNLPRGLQVIFATNRSARQDSYQISREERVPIDAFVNSRSSLLILAAHNDTVRSLRGFFGRRVSIWEGHTREAMTSLVQAVQSNTGNAAGIAAAIASFMYKVSRGFTPSTYGKIFIAAVESQCSRPSRGKPAILQELARAVLDMPNHKGVGVVLRRIEELARTVGAFEDIKIDHYREFWEAARLADFDDPEEGLSELTRRRSRAQAGPPQKSISTVHKAKGLECGNALVMPCDDKHFPEASRCLLYVALSRARNSLQIVVSRDKPSPLLEL